MDKRVISLPLLPRFLLVYGVIGLFRSPKSAKLYQALWTEKASPLLHYSLSLEQKVQQMLGIGYIVRTAMRYSEPRIESVLDEFKRKQIDRVVAVPLYPQYASSTTGSSIEAMFKIVCRWSEIPAIEVRPPFYADPWFVHQLGLAMQPYLMKSYDAIVFSYHGLPESHLKNVHAGSCGYNGCSESITDSNKNCYRAQCYETTRKVSKELGLGNDITVVTSFQSRLSRKWIGPFTDESMDKLLVEGKKRVLVVCPSFVADCLETTIEIGVELKHQFMERGGELLDVVPCLNDSDEWAHALSRFIL